ncbi:MAG TPA: histidine kinase [Chitinophagaceae bacterium]
MPVSLLNIKKHRWVFIAGFLLLTAIHAQILRSLGLDWETALWDSAVTNFCFAAGCILMTNTLRYYLPRKYQYIILVVWSVTLSTACFFISKWILQFIFNAEQPYLEILDNSMTIRFWVGVLIISWIGIVSILWYRQQESSEVEKRKADTEKLSRDAELYKLRQQLQPHFLFNSLNSISALAGSQPEMARKMIHQLSEFLRGTLRKEEHQWVTLADELQHLTLYLEIEKVRFGHRLSTSIVSDEASNGFRLPSMLLQPIVENAIKFGLYDTTDSIIVNISAKVEGDQLVIEVKNPFDPSTSGPLSGTGFGLTSVQRRLYLLFARNDLLATKAEGNIFITTVKIPQHDQSITDRR